jgi:cation diffusion facilitator CzcD-associated flavoprotein CzcO
MNTTNAVEPPDRTALRARYRAERDKRLRSDGSDQYIEPTGRFAHFREDTFTERVERDPVTDEVTVAIIGGGFAGLTTGARLAEAGVTDVRLIEGGGDVGGAWYWNRYPGAMCDTAAMVYLPLLEETGHMPTQKYTMGHENFAHAQRIATHYGLYQRALFSTEVTSLEWDEATSRWLIGTDRGDAIRARFVAMGTGPMHRPKLPGIPGLDTFEGHCFHTSRWDYPYTGGSPSGEPMDRLADKRVGIIGTGATAVQAIPHLARDSGELFVFQRTPSSIDVRNNRPTDPAEFDALEAGWQRRWLDNFATLQTGGFTDEDLVMDGWTDIAKRIRDRVVLEMTSTGEAFTPELVARAYEDSDDEKMTEIRARVASPTRAPPRHSSRGIASCASGPASTTSTCRPTTGPTPTWSTPTGREWRRSTPPGCGPPASTTRSTASSSPRGSTCTWPIRPPMRPPAETVSRCPSTGSTACAACTAPMLPGSPTCSSSGSTRAPT